MSDMRKSIKVTIGQTKHEGKFEDIVDLKKRIRYLKPREQLDSLFRVIDAAKRDGADFVLLPELFLPRQYLRNIRAISEENRLLIIGGLEYGPFSHDPDDKLEPLANSAFVAIPSTFRQENLDNGTMPRQCTIIEVPKFFPADEEAAFIQQCGYSFANGNRVYLFESSVIGNFAVLICVDFLNLPIQALLQGKIQTLFIVAYNQDVEYYVSLADTMHRLLLCNVVVCNIGNFGGSLSFTPYRTGYLRNVYQVKGNMIEAAVTVELPLKRLYEHQKGVHSAGGPEDGKRRFIRKSPDFGRVRIQSSAREE